MFADTHLLDVTRLTTLGHPLSYILAVPFLYLFTLPASACFFRSARDPLASDKVPAPAGNPRLDDRLLPGILAGAFVLWQSNVPNMVYLFVSLCHAALGRHPL